MVINLINIAINVRKSYKDVHKIPLILIIINSKIMLRSKLGNCGFIYIVKCEFCVSCKCCGMLLHLCRIYNLSHLRCRLPHTLRYLLEY